MKKVQVCLVGMFPPPLHGMSLINNYVRNLISQTAKPLVLDYSPRDLDRSLALHLVKAFRALRCLILLCSHLISGRVGSVYLGLSGGNGQAYDAMFVGISRMFGRRLYLHHHSYHYIRRHRWLSSVLFFVAGKKAVHIVACEKMENDLRSQYPVVTQLKVISGIAALEFWSGAPTARKNIQAIGFLSNISIEKGVLEFLDVAAWAEQAGLSIRFVLAGPYQNEQARSLVESRVAVLSNVTGVGAVYGSEKQAFFDSIDVFLFPTQYVNESEGLVIHEAMSRGVPVIAYSRGCIEQIVSDSVGLRLAPGDDYVADSIARINEWLQHPDAFEAVSGTCLSRFCEAQALHTERMRDLCTELIGSSEVEAGS